MRTTQLLTGTEEAALAATIEIGILAEEALTGSFAVSASRGELDLLAREGHAARERLLLANVGLVTTIVRGELGRSPADYAEVLQEGHLALAEALVRYDHRRGRFGPYAAAWIRARVRAAVVTQCGRAGVPARDLARYYAVRRAEVDLMQSLGRSVTSSEIPHLDDIAAVRAVVAPGPLAAALSVPDESASRHLDHDADPNVRVALDRLPSLDRRVLRRRFGFDGQPVPRGVVARELGVSEATVRRIEARGLARLRERLVRLDAA